MEETRVISVIREVMPAVVSIMLAKHLTHIEKRHPKGYYPFFPAQKREHATPVPEHNQHTIGGGSGFIVEESGLIVTNKHVVLEEDLDYTVILTDGRTFPASVVSRDPMNDVAILRIEATDLPTIGFGDVSTLQLGQSVIAIGNALGVFKNTVSSGIVSGLSRSVSAQATAKSPVQELRGLIQTDAAINPGNSGGPLVTLDGKAIGINAALISGAQNISLAIPINAVHRDLNDLKQYGRIRRPYVGIRYIMLDQELAAAMDVPVSYGAYITKDGPHEEAVILGSPAAQAGLRETDVILAANGKKLEGDYSFQDVLDTSEIGDSVQLDIWRNGSVEQLAVTLTEKQ